MSTTQPIVTPKKQIVADTRIGEHSAIQPVSGISIVDETFAVNGMGRGGYVRKEEAEKKKPANS